VCKEEAADTCSMTLSSKVPQHPDESRESGGWGQLGCNCVLKAPLGWRARRHQTVPFLWKLERCYLPALPPGWHGFCGAHMS
jgi:hypothetical protein